MSLRVVGFARWLPDPLRSPKTVAHPPRHPGAAADGADKKTAPEGADNLTREKTTALLPLHTSEEDQRV
jgi:hypothetical protein